LRALVETLDALLVTTAAGKGLLPEDHAANLGASLPYAPTQALAAEADVILAVGTELAKPMCIRHCGCRSRALDSHRHRCGQAFRSLRARGAHLGRRAQVSRRLRAACRSAWVGAAASAAPPAHAQRSTTASCAGARPVDGAAAIRAALPADGVVFSDMTQIAYLGNYAFPTDLPGCWMHPSGYGTLGFAMPAAIGAKIAAPARAVLALAGDYGLQFTINELITAVEQGVSCRSSSGTTQRSARSATTCSPRASRRSAWSAAIRIFSRSHRPTAPARRARRIRRRWEMRFAAR
jgi:5-guanidino-2-oxopentanoate decarboxylase